MEHAEHGWRFRGFQSPNFTSVPDEFFDVLAPRLNGGEVKVLLYIIRRTFGFKKERDTISISQMLSGIVKRNGERLDHGVGLSKPSLCRALNTLAEKNIIIATRQFDMRGGNMATCYQLNVHGGGQQDHESADSGTLGKKMRQGGLSQNFTKPLSQELTKPLVKKRDTQYTVYNRQNNKNVNVANKGNKPDNYLYMLPDAHSEDAHVDLIAEDILEALGDTQSKAFYTLVARKVPEHVIRETLSSLKQGRARSKERVFTQQMMDHAKSVATAESAAVLDDARSKLAEHLRVH